MTSTVRSPISIKAALEEGIATLMVPVYADIAEDIMQFAPVEGGWIDHCGTLCTYIRMQLNEIARLNDVAALFQARYAQVEDGEERRAAVLDLAAKLGADRAQLRKDRKALDKWFDSDAVLERYRRRVGRRERAVAHAAERAGLAGARAVSIGECTMSHPVLSKDFADTLADLRSYRGEPRIRESAHVALRHIAQTGKPVGKTFWIELALRETRRTALDWRETAWAQCAAFDTLAEISVQNFTAIAGKRIAEDRDAEKPQRRDAGLFVRRHLAHLVARKLHHDARLGVVLERLSLDPEGAVRQAVAFAIPAMPADTARAMATRCRIDADPQVRAALFDDPAGMARTCGVKTYRTHLERVLSRETAEFVLRIAIDAAARLCQHLREEQADAELAETAIAFKAALIALRNRVSEPKLRRWASEAHERIWLASDQAALALAVEIRKASAKLNEGEARRVPALGETVRADPNMFGRVMAVLAQNDYGLDIEQTSRPSLQRGDRLARRLWRTLFEMRHKATDKRQAFLHTIGRTYRGTLSAPSARMAELAPTKVPGEPLFQSDDGNWRNWLPLIDHVLSAIDLGQPIRIFTSEGITTITPPTRFVARAKSYWRLSRDFSTVAELRNRVGHEYAGAIRKFGVDVSFAPYGSDDMSYMEEGVPPDPSVTRFFSFGAPLAALPVLWNEIVGYAATVFANTLGQLALFLALVCLWFFGRHIVLGQHARRVREGIALSLGGWGTRGKSGTERLKAGLINALGPPLVSKTTGCEAMFLNGEAFGELTEMFLFRPYDKATIWEQYNLIKITRRLGGRVFLWECMGLNPSYVRVLQRHWMRDDIGTLTNTYPDHEDVQGPAGRDIPIVMTEFIPENSICLTTEEEMLPILKEGARKANTRMRAVNWRQAGLIHKDLLARFPYEEHPYNIALVTAMGDELGLEPDFCIKEMSDRVVADLGVLKTYPRARIEDRTVEYVMGNSANERFGAMGNWERMGFQKHDFAVDPEIYISTVVNNRADRVPRSRVFARILVTDIAADKHFLIGSNIEGLMGFIEEEWAEYERSLTLGEEGKDPLDLFAEWAKRQRVPLQKSALVGLLATMIEGVTGSVDSGEVERTIDRGSEAELCERLAPERADAILAHYRELAGYYAEYEKLRGAISASGSPASHDGEVRAFLRRVFMAKLVPVRDYYIKGEQIVRLVVRATPPGLVNRIMGMQNIKGTGLDFVYRWQAWEAVSRACDQALDPDEAVSAKGLTLLTGFQEYGRLSEARVKATVAEVLSRGTLPPGLTAPQIEAILARVDEQIAAIPDASLGSVDADNAKTTWGERARTYGMTLLEGVLDGGDAVRRRRKADRIYEALIAEQISNPRAVLELKKLTSRQKGGWLVTALGDGLGRWMPRRR